MPNFELSYMTQFSTFSIEGGVLNYKISFMKGTIETSKIVYFRKFEYSDYDQLVIRYRKEDGKLKNLQALCDKGNQGLQQLLYELSQILPEKDLTNTSAPEARKLMNIMNSAKVGIWGAIILVFIIFAVILLLNAGNSGLSSIAIWVILGIAGIILAIAFVVVYVKNKGGGKDF